MMRMMLAGTTSGMTIDWARRRGRKTVKVAGTGVYTKYPIPKTDACNNSDSMLQCKSQQTVRHQSIKAIPKHGVYRFDCLRSIVAATADLNAADSTLKNKGPAAPLSIA